MRLLHLIQPLPAPAQWWHLAPPASSGVGPLACVRWMIESEGSPRGIEHVVCVMGSRDAREVAADAGLDAVVPLSVPLGNPRLAARALLDLVRTHAPPPDAIIAWGPHLTALRDALVADRLGIAWVEVCTATARARLTAEQSFVAIEPVLPNAGQSATPRATRSRDRAWTFARPARIAMLSGPRCPASARTALTTCEILTVAGVPAHALLDRSAPDAPHCVELAARSYTPAATWTSRHPLRILRDADLAIIAPSGPVDRFELSTLFACAAARRVPVVTTRQAALASGIDADALAHLGCIAHGAGPAALAKVALRMLEDPAQGRACIDALRQHCSHGRGGPAASLQALIEARCGPATVAR